MAFESKNKHVRPRNNVQILLASLVIGLGLTSALAMGVAGHGYRVATAHKGQAAIAQSQAQSETLEAKLEAFSLKRRNEIQALAQLSLLSHEKIRASLSPEEQWQALAQYSSAYEGYESITFVDLQGNVVMPVQGSAGSPVVARTLAEQAISQRNIVDDGLALDGNAFQLVAPVLDKATGQVIGTIEAVMSDQSVNAALKASADAAEIGDGEAQGVIAFQLQEDLAMMMALSLPIASLLLAGLILFWDHHIHQALLVPPARLQSLMAVGDASAGLRSDR